MTSNSPLCPTDISPQRGKTVPSPFGGRLGRGKECVSVKTYHYPAIVSFSPRLGGSNFTFYEKSSIHLHQTRLSQI